MKRAVFLVSSYFFVSLIASAGERTDAFCRRYAANQERVQKVFSDGWFERPQSAAFGSNPSNTSVLRAGCLQVPWIEQAARVLCEGESAQISMPKAIFFYFDGTEYFSPREAKALGAVNLIGTEPAQLFRHSVQALESRWIPALERSGVSWNRDVEFHYHSGVGAPSQGIENALACFRSIREDLEDLGALGIVPPTETPKLIVSGHSIGGATALKFAEKVRSEIDLLLLVDPVSNVSGFLFEKLTGSKAQLGSDAAVSHIRRIVNIYQDSDTGALAGVMSIRGTRVPFAQREVSLEMPSDWRFGHRADHILMLTNPTTIAVFAEEMSAVARP